MILAGKCPPEPEALTMASELGFDAVELYITKDHLDAFDDVLSNVRTADVDVTSVHTPHVLPDEERYLLDSDALARRLDAYLVVHSQYAGLFCVPQFESLDLRADRGYENPVGASRFHLERTILDPGHDLVLDTAHLFTAERSFLDELEHLLRGHADRIRVVHLCDSTYREDGLAFGRGNIDLRSTIRLIRETFDGVLILEVMPEHQSDARQQFLAAP